jgi:Zn-dependent protease with chaperone function
MKTDARFFDGEIARDHMVIAELTPQGLAIEGLGVTPRVWSLSGLNLIAKAQPGHPLRLGYENEPGARLVVTQEAFTRELMAQAPHLAGGFNARRAGRVAAIIALCALATAGVLSYAPQTLAFVLPDSWRNSLGDQVEATLASNGKLCATSATNASLRSLGNRLREGNADMPPFEIKVYDIKILNAFALPGGRIIVTRKLIDEVKAPEEVAGVLAHEIGHVYHRHSEAQLIRATGIELLLKMASGGGDTISGFAGLLAVLRYSRDAEREADSFAQTAMVNAAIDPTALKSFFEAMKKLLGDRGSTGGLFGTVSDMMSTHPMTDERIAAIKPLPEGTVARPVLSDIENLQLANRQDLTFASNFIARDFLSLAAGPFANFPCRFAVS